MITFTERSRSQVPVDPSLLEKMRTETIEKSGTSEGAYLGWEHRDRGKGGKKEKKSQKVKDLDITDLVLRSNNLSSTISQLQSKVDEKKWVAGTIMGRGSNEYVLSPPEMDKIVTEIVKLKNEKIPITNEIHDRCHAEFKKIAPDTVVNFRDVDASFAWHITEQAKVLVNDYPDAMKSLKWVGSKSIGGWGQYSNEHKEISLDHFLFGEDGADTLYKELRESVNTGWHPPGCDTPESIFTHEFAHHLYNEWIHRPPKTIYQTGSGLNWTPEDDMITLLWGDLSSHPVSEYAKKDRGECFAESFTSVYHTPKDKQTPEIKRMNKILNTPFWKQMWEAKK
jgi:hypothetical protein